ncbi:MAG: tetratricopeptide repeat protein [Armatimonadetes bacterium]|nr:tetratricopeptide repeat protein [Armatimonadota bacterium]
METLLAIDDFWDFSDPAGTEIKFREALDHAPEDAEDYRAELITQIARTFGLRGKFEEAHELLDQVAEMLPRTGDYVETRYLLERGRAFNSAGEKQKAKELFLQAVDTSRRAKDDYLTVDVMHMLAIVEDPESALEWNLQAIQILEETKQEKAKSWIGPLSNNVAWTYHDIGEYETALSYFEKGRDYRAIEAKEPGYRIAKWAVARCKRSLGRLDEALAEQLASAAEYYPEFDAQSEAADIDGYIAEEIAECLLALEKNDEAKLYFSAAYKTLSKDDWLVENEPDRIARLKDLGS